MTIQVWKKRGALFLLNMSMLACAVLCLCMFFLSLTVYQAASELHVVGLPLRRDARFLNDLVELTPFDETEPGALGVLLEEMLVRYYLEMRYSVISDKQEMLRRWGTGGIVHRLSPGSVFAAFSVSDDDLAKLMEKKQTQSVDIRSISKPQRGLYVVEFDLYTLNGEHFVKRTYNASLRYIHVPSYKWFSSEMSNPFGMVFVGFDSAEKKTDKKY